MRARMVCNAALLVFIAQQAAWSACADLEPSPSCRVDPRTAVDTGIAQQSRALLQARREQSSEMTLEGPLAMTELVKSVDTPFSWVTLETTPNPKLYRDTVDGLCLKIMDSCTEEICECPGATSNCANGVKNDYTMNAGPTSAIKNITQNHIRLTLQGKVDYGKKQPGQECTAYTVGSGPYAITNELEVKVGDVAKFEFTAKQGNDDYELFAGLFSKSRGLVAYKFTRGVSQQWEAFELPADQKDIYHVEFMLASYDRTNGGAIGATMEIKDVMVTKASSPQPTAAPTPMPTPMPTPQPTPAPTVPPHAANTICVKNTEWAKTVWFRVKYGSTLIYKSGDIFVGGTKCVNITNKVADLATVKVVIGVAGGLPTGKRTYSVTKHSHGKVWTQNCKKWSYNWACYAE